MPLGVWACIHLKTLCRIIAGLELCFRKMEVAAVLCVQGAQNGREQISLDAARSYCSEIG